MPTTGSPCTITEMSKSYRMVDPLLGARIYSTSLIQALAVVVVTACGSDITEPATSFCATRNGVEVCVAGAEYSPGELVRFTVHNTSGTPVYKDSCATKLVGNTGSLGVFDEVFDPTLHCGSDASVQDIIANMIELVPGEETSDSLQLVTFAFQGYYRVNVWIVDADGALVSNAPAISGTFHVFPSAN